jgi:AcrR family transcriptional regulator
MSTPNDVVYAAGPRFDTEERQRQLVEACAYLIATRGYSKTSVRDIAGQVGISTGTLLHHFRSKEELLVATLLAVSDGFLEDIRKIAQAPLDPVEKLRRLARDLLETPRHDVGWRVWIAFWHEAATNDELGSIASDRSELSESIISQIIDEGRTLGRLRSDDPAGSASELAVLIDGLAIRLFGESGRWTQAQAIALLDRLIDDWCIEDLAGDRGVDRRSRER